MDKLKNKSSKSKKGGRPKSTTPKIYSKRLEVKLTDDEYSTCKKNLTALGYRHFTVFVRDSLIKKEIRVKKKLFGDEESSKIIRQIGNNINQIAHTLNSFSKESDRKMLSDYHEILNDFRKEFPSMIQKLLSNDS